MRRISPDHKFPTKGRHSVSKDPSTPNRLLRRLSNRANSTFFGGAQAQAEGQKMPTYTNGVRGGSSKSSDQKKDQELGSPSNRDLARRNTQEPQNPLVVLAASGGPLQRIADIVQYFVSSSSFTQDISAIEEVYGTEIDREKKIRALNEKLEILTHHKSEEMETLRGENKTLLAEREACQQERKECQEIEEKLEAYYAKADATRQEESKKLLQEEKAKLYKQVKTKKAEFEEEINQKVRELEDNHLKLSTTNKDLEQRCLAAEEKLETKKQRHARVEKSLEDENKKLTEELKHLQTQFPVERQSIEYYTQQFGQISDVIKEISSTYFKILPDHAKTNPEAVQEELCKLSPVFAATPIWPSPVSEFLRMRNVEHLISTCVCDSIWQPFPQDTLPNHQGVSQLLENISTSLSASGGRSESVWRVLTLRGIHTPNSNQVDSSIQQVLSTLHPLTPPSSSAPLKTSLLTLFATSAALWSTARKDEARISITSHPDPATWLAVDLPTLDPLSLPPNATPDTALKPLPLFPHIEHRSATGDITTLHPGSVLLPSARVCVEGVREKRRHEEEVAREVSDARCRVNMRRLSVPVGPASPTGGRFAVPVG